MSSVELGTGLDGGPLLIAAAQVAQLLGISKRTLWRLNSAGQLPAPVRLGSAPRWRFDEIKNWIARGCPALDTTEN